MGGRAGGFDNTGSPNVNQGRRGDQRRFEYDPAKSASNKEKHGIDFEEAKALWEDDDKFAIPSKYQQESRELVIAQVNGKTYVAVTTTRENRIRIISVRRARGFEVKMYEENRNDG
jgi:uncharacterized DUF497 family protein